MPYPWQSRRSNVARTAIQQGEMAGMYPNLASYAPGDPVEGRGIRPDWITGGGPPSPGLAAPGMRRVGGNGYGGGMVEPMGGGAAHPWQPNLGGSDAFNAGGDAAAYRLAAAASGRREQEQMRQGLAAAPLETGVRSNATYRPGQAQSPWAGFVADSIAARNAIGEGGAAEIPVWQGNGQVQSGPVLVPSNGPGMADRRAAYLTQEKANKQPRYSPQARQAMLTARARGEPLTAEQAYWATGKGDMTDADMVRGTAGNALPWQVPVGRFEQRGAEGEMASKERMAAMGADRMGSAKRELMQNEWNKQYSDAKQALLKDPKYKNATPAQLDAILRSRLPREPYQALGGGSPGSGFSAASPPLTPGSPATTGNMIPQDDGTFIDATSGRKYVQGGGGYGKPSNMVPAEQVGKPPVVAVPPSGKLTVAERREMAKVQKQAADARKARQVGVFGAAYDQYIAPWKVPFLQESPYPPAYRTKAPPWLPTF